eukprot:TRINITY_DN95599_c0_g1_i1.p1 TRINITY_DN95599_c0_g1~~TRINITY_DN95599_c0_g1_i1.p1  ORF type:complete len:200 (-),score=32.27 TRINITY_DN95599_c0_g1_i1:21-620(-)
MGRRARCNAVHIPLTIITVLIGCSLPQAPPCRSLVYSPLWQPLRRDKLQLRAGPWEQRDRTSWAWSVLDLPEGSPAQKIRKRYRQLAGNYHPDRWQGNAGAKERFEEVTAAYQLLMQAANATPRSTPSASEDRDSVFEVDDADEDLFSSSPEQNEQIGTALLMLLLFVLGLWSMSEVSYGLTWERCFQQWEWWCNFKGS